MDNKRTSYSLEIQITSELKFINIHYKIVIKKVIVCLFEGDAFIEEYSLWKAMKTFEGVSFVSTLRVKDEY